MAQIYTVTNAKGGAARPRWPSTLPSALLRRDTGPLLSTSTSRGNLSAGLGVDLNQLKSMAHRLLINEAPEIHRYLIEIRPQLNLLPNSIDIEADDLLEAKKVNRELLPL